MGLQSLVWIEGWIIVHPYMTVLTILCLVVGVMGLCGPFGDDPTDWEVEQQRLD